MHGLVTARPAAPRHTPNRLRPASALLTSRRETGGTSDARIHLPGQVSQSVGMDKALAEASKEEPRLLASFGPLRAP